MIVVKKKDDEEIIVQANYCKDNDRKYKHVNTLDKYLYKDVMGIIYDYIMPSQEELKRRKGLCMFQIRTLTNNPRWNYHYCPYCDLCCISDRQYVHTKRSRILKEFLLCHECSIIANRKKVLAQELRAKFNSQVCVIM